MNNLKFLLLLKAAGSSLLTMSLLYLVIMLGIDVYFKSMGISYNGGALYYLLYFLMGLLPAIIWLSLVGGFYQMRKKKNFTIILVVGVILTALLAFMVNGKNFLSKDFLFVLFICELLLIIGTWIFDVRFKELNKT